MINLNKQESDIDSRRMPIIITVDNEKRIIDSNKSSNSIFGLGQINTSTIIRRPSVINTDTDTVSSSSVESGSIDTFDSSLDSYSSDESDATRTDSSKEWTLTVSLNKNGKKYNILFKHVKKKKDIIEVKYNYYIGETITGFDKNSPFISMLVNRRNRQCEVGPMRHIAAFVSDLGIENKFTNWAFGKFAIGENSDRVRYGNNKLSTHAEIDALKKLDNLIRVRRCKKQNKMDLVVIRVNKSGNLCESAPCYHCTKELSESKVVSINKLYFSRYDGTITCIKFSDWLKNDNFHVSKGWKRICDERSCK